MFQRVDIRTRIGILRTNAVSIITIVPTTECKARRGRCGRISDTSTFRHILPIRYGKMMPTLRSLRGNCTAGIIHIFIPISIHFDIRPFQLQLIRSRTTDRNGRIIDTIGQRYIRYGERIIPVTFGVKINMTIRSIH